MKLLHVNSGNHFGGVESIFLTLARHASLSPGLQHEFALCFSGRLSRELDSLGFPVHLLGGVRTRNPVSIWKARGQFKRVLASGAFDAVVVHSSWAHAMFAPTVRQLKKVLFFWLHGHASCRHWTERWAQRTSPDMLIAVSKAAGETARHLFPGVPYRVLYAPMGVSPARPDEMVRREVRQELGTTHDAIVIIQVGRLEEGKGHARHLEALARLTHVPGWVCWMIGGPQKPEEVSYLQNLQHLTQTLGLSDRVQFLGERSDVPRLLQAGDIFCSPNSRPEGLGLVFQEAGNARLPVVTTAFGGAVEIVTEASGILVPPGDITALANALQELLADSRLRSQLGEAGFAHVWDQCDPSRQMAYLHEIVQQVVSR